MSAGAGGNALQRNLARLRRLNRTLAAEVERAGDGETELRTGPRGATTVAWKGTLLASAYDPRGEGERLAATMLQESGDVAVAIGFGLGHHLEAWREQCDVPLLVYEPSPARLRAALAARPDLRLWELPDVEWVTDGVDLAAALERRYVPGLRLQVHVHPALARSAPDEVRRALERIRRVKDSSDVTANTRVSKLHLWTNVTARNAARIVGSPGFELLREPLAGRPVVVAAAGPSLDQQLDALGAYRDRVVIVAIGQALGALRRAGVTPHLVHVVESQPIAHQLERGGTPADVCLVATPDAHPGAYDAGVRARFVATPSADRLGGWIADALGFHQRVSGGATVAQSAVGLAAALGAPAVMLIGQDLAFTGGRAYASGSAYDEVGVEVAADGTWRTRGHNVRRALMGRPAIEEAEQEVYWVEGWHGDRVPTSLSYATFIEHYRSIGNLFRAHGLRLLNCTEGGARTPGLEHRPFSEALRELAAAPFDTTEAVLAVHDGWRSPGPEALCAPIARVDRALDALRDEARRGVAAVERAEGRLRRRPSPSEQIELLRRVARSERRLRGRLDAVPWVDGLVQPELLEGAARVRRAGSSAPTPERALEEARFLFEAALAGVERSRETLGWVRWALWPDEVLKPVPARSEDTARTPVSP